MCLDLLPTLEEAMTCVNQADTYAHCRFEYFLATIAACGRGADAARLRKLLKGEQP